MPREVSNVMGTLNQMGEMFNKEQHSSNSLVMMTEVRQIQGTNVLGTLEIHSKCVKCTILNRGASVSG